MDPSSSPPADGPPGGSQSEEPPTIGVTPGVIQPSIDDESADKVIDDTEPPIITVATVSATSDDGEHAPPKSKPEAVSSVVPPGDSEAVNPTTPSRSGIENPLITKEEITKVLKEGTQVVKADSVTLDNLHHWLNVTLPTGYNNLLVKFRTKSDPSKAFKDCANNQLIDALNELLPMGSKIQEGDPNFWYYFGNNAVVRQVKMTQPIMKTFFITITQRWKEKNVTPQQRKMAIGSTESKSTTPHHVPPSWIKRVGETKPTYSIKNNEGVDVEVTRVFTIPEAIVSVHDFIREERKRSYEACEVSFGSEPSPDMWKKIVNHLGTNLVGSAYKCTAAEGLSEFCRYSFRELKSDQMIKLEEYVKKLWRPVKYVTLEKDGKPVTFVQGVVEVGAKGDNGFRVPICIFPIRLVGPGGYLYIIRMNCTVSVEKVDGEEEEPSTWNIMKVGKTDVFHTNKIPKLYSREAKETIDPITGVPVAGGGGGGSGEAKSDLDCLKSLDEHELYVRARTPMERFMDTNYKDALKWLDLSTIQGGTGRPESICSCKKCVSESLRDAPNLPKNFYGIIAVDPPNMPDAQEDYMRSILGVSYSVFDETETILARSAKFNQFRVQFLERIRDTPLTIPTPPEALRMFSSSTKLRNVTITLNQGRGDDDKKDEWKDACVHALHEV